MPTKKVKQTGNNSMVSRRQFLQTSALASAAFSIVPRHVLGGPGFVSPSDKLNIAAIGVGGKGQSDIAAVATENIVALCDVDDVKMAGTLKRAKEYVAQQKAEGKGDGKNPLEKAKKYKDFRVMLDTEQHIDAVTVSTPEPFHAYAAMTAIKRGKHTFVQKPLTYCVGEARKLREAAQQAGVITQMGNQGHAGEGIRLICEWLADGAIGEVREVECWTNRPVWKTGMDRPKEIPSVPASLDWNLWIGPAPFRPYHPAYAPWAGRAWCDFGTGALGDMGAHIFDIPYHALKMKYPTKVQASSTKFNGESWPVASVIRYDFPERDGLPAVKLTWSDGGIMPKRPAGIEPGRKMGDSDGGVLFIGDKGLLMCGCYGSNPRLVPESFMKAYQLPEKTIPRSPGIHQEWIQCIKEGKQATSNFEYASRLTETMMLGNIAIRMASKNTPLAWDGEKGEVTNLPEANEFVMREYQNGYKL